MTMMRTYVCTWCAAPVTPNYDHVDGTLTGCKLTCKGTFLHPASGSCRRRFTDLGHHQVSELPPQ